MKKLILILFVFSSLISLSQELKPNDKKALLNITVTDFSNNPKQGEKVVFVSKNTKKELVAVSNTKGKCSLLLSKGDTYDIKYKNFSDNIDYSKIEVPNEDGLLTFDMTLQFEPAKTYTLKNVLFDTGKATLKPSSNVSLNDLYDVLKLKKTMVVEIAGHTDNEGSPETNLKLSQSRANSVRNYLIEKGISANRIKAVGYGETQPVADNSTTQGKQKNRRTEVRIIKE